MKKEALATDRAPRAIGPYSQATIANGFLFISGQIPIDPATGELVQGIEEQTRQALRNIGAILNEAGLDHGHIVKTTVFMTDLADFALMNGAYEEFFDPPYPARAAFGVAALPKGASVEIEAVALFE